MIGHSGVIRYGAEFAPADRLSGLARIAYRLQDEDVASASRSAFRVIDSQSLKEDWLARNDG